ALWIPGALTILLLLGLNLVAVRLFGELEFWFAIIKLVAITALILVGAEMVISRFQSPDGDIAAVSNLIDHGDLFPYGITGCLAGFQIAIFGCVGVEVAGTAAPETKDPEKNLPRAINSIPVRVVVVYILALASIMMVARW